MVRQLDGAREDVTYVHAAVWQALVQDEQPEERLQREQVELYGRRHTIASVNPNLTTVPGTGIYLVQSLTSFRLLMWGV